MADKDLKTRPHHHRGEGTWWWYEDPKGMTVVVEPPPTRIVEIPWRSIRAALRRKDRK